MKRVGVRSEGSSGGVGVPVREDVDLRDEGEERIPERMAIPSVPR